MRRPPDAICVEKPRWFFNALEEVLRAPEILWNFRAAR